MRHPRLMTLVVEAAFGITEGKGKAGPPEEDCCRYGMCRYWEMKTLGQDRRSWGRDRDRDRDRERER